MSAGCLQSVSLARGLLYQLVHDLSSVIPRCPCWAHVGDLSHPLVAKSAVTLRQALLEAGRLVGDEVSRLKLRLSTKFKALHSNSTTRAVARCLTTEGIPMTAAKSTDDMGIDMTVRVQRKTAARKASIANARNRAKRTNAMVRFDRTALKLVNPSTGAMQSYGHQVVGSTASETMAMRRNIKRATHLAGPACVTTSLALLRGSNADLGVKGPVETIDMWLQSGLGLTRKTNA